jgi:hypothetical protein
MGAFVDSGIVLEVDNTTFPHKLAVVDRALVNANGTVVAFLPLANMPADRNLAEDRAKGLHWISHVLEVATVFGVGPINPTYQRPPATFLQSAYYVTWSGKDAQLRTVDVAVLDSESFAAGQGPFPTALGACDAGRERAPAEWSDSPPAASLHSEVAGETSIPPELFHPIAISIC